MYYLIIVLKTTDRTVGRYIKYNSTDNSFCKCLWIA